MLLAMVAITIHNNILEIVINNFFTPEILYCPIYQKSRVHVNFFAQSCQNNYTLMFEMVMRAAIFTLFRIKIELSNNIKIKLRTR